MVRNFVKVTVLPCMLGILLFTGSETNTTYTYTTENYLISNADFDFTVPVEAFNSLEKTSYKPSPLTPKNYVGFKEAIAFKESQGDYEVVNKFGYMGKYQFGVSTLDLIGIKNPTTFLKNPELQEKAFFLNASRNKWVLRRDIARYSNTWIDGVKITESGILAAAHLAGPGSVKKYLRSGGQDGFEDAFGTSIRSYLKRFSGYDVSYIPQNRKAHIKQLDLPKNL